MSFYDAEVADILRLNQRDEIFVNEVECDLHSFLRHFNARTYHKLYKSVPLIVNVWYYLLTSLSNVQTLGEEYTGTLRVADKKIPTKLCQTIWLMLYVGGEPLVQRLLKASENKIRNSSSLTQEAKDVLSICVEYIREQRQTLKRLHHALFYINKKYYTIPNRITGIRYVLVRQWLQDQSFSGSFQLLGKITLFYTFFNFIQNFLHKSFSKADDLPKNANVVSEKGCVLCSENITNPTATFCGHIFCWNCLHDSLKYQKVCPICREEVTPNRVIFLQNYG